MNRLFLVGLGHIGSYLAKKWSLSPEWTWSKNMSEISTSFLKALNPKTILITAGKTDLGWCEQHADECIYNNIAAPVQLARIARSLDIQVIHLSSGCVWDGPFTKASKGYRPTDPVTPACVYSWSKAACDALLLSEHKQGVTILRPRQIYSNIVSPRNSLVKLAIYENLLMSPNSMTSIDTIAKTVEYVTQNKGCPQLINVFDRGYLSPYDVGKMLFAAGVRDKAPGSLGKLDLDSWHRPKRVDTVLDDTWFVDHINPPDLREELTRMIVLYREALVRENSG